MADLRVSTTDPDATLMLTKHGADMGSHTHDVVDGGKARIFLQVLVTPWEVMDNQPMFDLLWRGAVPWVGGCPSGGRGRKEGTRGEGLNHYWGDYPTPQSPSPYH